ncbi:MAG: hypothetical protein AAB840_01780 [Patescibacteria group bacterium]
MADFEYTHESRPVVICTLTNVKSVETFLNTIDSLLETDGLKGKGEHDLALELFHRYLNKMTAEECWCLATIAQTKSKLYEFAYNCGFRKAERSIH